MNFIFAWITFTKIKTVLINIVNKVIPITTSIGTENNISNPIFEN